MTSLFHFEKKIHRKHLSIVETIPLLFPRLLSHVLEHLGFSAEPHQEHHRDCEATFTVEKWQFVPGAPPIPAYPYIEVDPLHVQMPLASPTQEPHITMSTTPTFDLVPAPPVPVEHSSPPAPTALAGPNSFSPPVASIHITVQDFLTIMVVVHNFAVTSQSFAAAQATMAERMASTEAVLAQNTAILDQVSQHLGLPPIPLTPIVAAIGSQARPPVAPAAAVADLVPVPPVASASVSPTHHATPAQS